MTTIKTVPPVQILRHPGGAAVVPIHYSMDPDKDANWVLHHKAKVLDVEDWEKEMEMNFLSVTGSRCFSSFSVIKNTGEVNYDPALPLCLTCDFNVSPMAWLVFQIHPGEHMKFIREIYFRDGSVEINGDEFINQFGHHIGDLWIFGDKSGDTRAQNNQRSNYNELRTRLSGHNMRIHMKVPMKNPSHVNAVKALNLRCSDQFGISRLTIDPVGCPEFVKDMVQVTWQDSAPGDTKSIKKVRNRHDPYFWRGHLSDAAMYAANRMWPVRVEEARKPVEEKNYDDFIRRRKARNKRKRLLGAFPGIHESARRR